MKLITKARLPRWVMKSFPFKEEDETLSGFIVPFVLFSLMGIGVLWYNLGDSLPALLKSLLALSIISLVAVIVWWLVVQIEVLSVLRKRLITHYKNTKDDGEKLRTRERLLDLYVNV